MKTFIHFWLLLAFALLPVQGQGILSLAGSPPAAGGITPVSPGTTSLLAWYDFTADATDDHSSYDLDTTGAPVFSGGYVTYDATSRNYAVGSLGNAFNHAAGDWAMVVRWKAYTSLANNSIFLSGSRMEIKYNTTATSVVLSDVTRTTTAGVLDTWFLTVASWDSGTNTLSVSTNGVDFVTSTGTPGHATGTMYFGSYLNVQIDFAGFYSKELTQGNAAWFYNSNATRVYADL